MAEQRMPVGVRFKQAGKVYYFDAGKVEVHIGDSVIVETSHGKEIAQVVISPDQVVASEIKESLKPILRLATEEDLAHSIGLRDRAHEVLIKARQVVEQQGADIRIVSADYDLDGSGVTLYYSAEERGDLRSLPRELGTALETKVSMLQVGERDRAKLADGFGRCGERMCCASWLSSFPSVSIKMAKEQELPLNPVKISGVCGRLLCCLTYEYESYKAVRSTLPKVGSRLSTPAGEAKIISINVPKETVTLLLLENMTTAEVTIEDFKGNLARALRPPQAEERPVEAVAAAQPAAAVPSRAPSRRRAEGQPSRRGNGRSNGSNGQPPAPQPRPQAAAEPAADEEAGQKKRRRRRGRRGGRRSKGPGESGGDGNGAQA